MGLNRGNDLARLSLCWLAVIILVIVILQLV